MNLDKLGDVSRIGWTHWASLAVLFLLLGSYVQQERRAMGGDYWKTRIGDDFQAYYVAGRVARGEGGGRLYYMPATGIPQTGFVDPRTPWGEIAHESGFHATRHFTYPPFFALLLKPLAYLPPQQALLVWRQLTALFVMSSILLVLIGLRATPFLPIFVVALAAALAFFPFQETMFLGQIGGLLLLVWTAGAWCADKKRPILGALFFALGAMVIVTPVLVVPLFLLRKQWKWLLGYVGWTALFLVVGVWQLGWDNHVTFFSSFLPAMSNGFPSSYNESLHTLIQSLYFGDAFHQIDARTLSIPPTVSWFGKAVSAALYCGVLIFFYRRNKEETWLGFELTVLVLVSLLIAPLTWRHHYLLILLPLLYLWVGAKRLSIPGHQYAVLMVATVTVGTVFPFYLLELVQHPALQIVVSAALAAGCIALLTLSLVHYVPLSFLDRLRLDAPAFSIRREAVVMKRDLLPES